MIVVADDDKVLTHLMTVLLEEHEYAVQVANDGKVAYDLLKNEECQCLLLDIRMPGISGAELLMLMTAEQIQVPVIVMAGYPDFDEEEMKQFPNVKKLFHKPLYPDEILQAVKKYALAPGANKSAS